MATPFIVPLTNSVMSPLASVRSNIPWLVEIQLVDVLVTLVPKVVVLSVDSMRHASNVPAGTVTVSIPLKVVLEVNSVVDVIGKPITTELLSRE